MLRLHLSLIVVGISGVLLLGSALPVFADAGVTLETTITVIGGSSGGGGYITPSSIPSITEIKQIGVQQQGSSYVSPAQPVQVSVPYVPPKQSDSITTVSDPVKLEEFKIDWFWVIMGVAVIGIIILFVRGRKQY